MSNFTGLIGILVFVGIAFLMSNNRKRINYKTVGVGFLLQVLLAVFILKVPVGQQIFAFIAQIINSKGWKFLENMRALKGKTSCRNIKNKKSE